MKTKSITKLLDYFEQNLPFKDTRYKIRDYINSVFTSRSEKPNLGPKITPKPSQKPAPKMGSIMKY